MKTTSWRDVVIKKAKELIDCGRRVVAPETSGTAVPKWRKLASLVSGVVPSTEVAVSPSTRLHAYAHPTLGF